MRRSRFDIGAFFSSPVSVFMNFNFSGLNGLLEEPLGPDSLGETSLGFLEEAKRSVASALVSGICFLFVVLLLCWWDLAAIGLATRI